MGQNYEKLLDFARENGVMPKLLQALVPLSISIIPTEEELSELPAFIELQKWAYPIWRTGEKAMKNGTRALQIKLHPPAPEYPGKKPIYDAYHIFTIYPFKGDVVRGNNTLMKFPPLTDWNEIIHEISLYKLAKSLGRYFTRREIKKFMEGKMDLPPLDYPTERIKNYLDSFRR